MWPFNFPLYDDADLRAKFIDMTALLGVALQTYDINIIHKLASNARSRAVIVRMNNGKLRNDILFAKKVFNVFFVLRIISGPMVKFVQ